MFFRLSCILVMLVFSACHPKSDTISGKVVDLTYPFDSETIYWPTEKGFELETEFKGKNPKGFFYEANKFTTPEHGGTHMDAPVHFGEGKHSVDEVPADQVFGPGVVVDVSDKVASDIDYWAEVKDFENWEMIFGRIPDGAIVLLRTGQGKYWPNRVAYMGTDERGPDAVAKLHFPGFSGEATQWLIDNRHVKAIGLDTPSTDYGQSTDYKTHRVLAAHNIPGLENLANLDQLPAKGFTVIGLPMKIKGGSGAPLRIIAVLPN